MKFIIPFKIFEKENNNNNIIFQEEYTDYHGGQHDIFMVMWVNDEKAAYADYSKFEDKIYIKYIESIIKGKGYGVELMKELAKRYGYENLERSSLTPSGVKMRQKLDKHFKFNYDDYLESKNKHIKIEVIEKVKNDTIKNFLLNIINLGYEKGWSKSIKELDILSISNDIDLNSISNITEWVKGSIENNNDTDSIPDEYTYHNLKQILIHKDIKDMNIK